VKTILEYLINGHVKIHKPTTPTIKFNSNLQNWISDCIDNGWIDYDIVKFLKNEDVKNVDMNLFYESSNEYLHLHKAFNKNSNTMYALSMLFDTDEDWPSEKQWDITNGDCVTLFRMDTTEEEEVTFNTFIDGLNGNLDILIR